MKSVDELELSAQKQTSDATLSDDGLQYAEGYYDGVAAANRRVESMEAVLSQYATILRNEGSTGAVLVARAVETCLTVVKNA